ncbi:cupin domain-containing protein [Kaistia dalseonensis]|uniref:Transcriptional regulator with XRE-family HTH domain n=1 Tax=Kaistia dalseonensis TaxID=410840 RepID=A0ABU0H336_9HYPH|nr:cupin domain-containing protein [Kaistia dalseonensis]MCX5494136.1 cupin domain-containing protein [Kaistia dalseonensis]MDQ0436715.1 transcriptional regulator with XRE-family HTH domain [Kaistia dalseonensis]
MSSDPLKVGEKIREARKQRKLTLQRVAEATGLSIGFLSQVERDITTPSLSSLVTIARALDLPVSSFLHQPDIPNAVSRREGRVAYSLNPNWASYERLSTTFPGQMLNAVKMNVPAHYLSETSAHEGEEIVYVLSGVIRYIIDGTIYELHVGDSLHFSAHRPHQVQNPTDELTELFSVGTQQLFADTPRGRALDSGAGDDRPSVSRRMPVGADKDELR